MRDVYKEYKQGQLLWEDAYLIANNNASDMTLTPEEIEYWCNQMESLGVDVAELVMRQLGYKETCDGFLYKIV